MRLKIVTPANAGVQLVNLVFKKPFHLLDTGVRRYDDLTKSHSR
jgi:hypothetical protein